MSGAGDQQERLNADWIVGFADGEGYEPSAKVEMGRLESSETIRRTEVPYSLRRYGPTPMATWGGHRQRWPAVPNGTVTKVTEVSVIPCRLIGGLHEGINEPPTVPTWNPVNPLAGEHAGVPRRETKTPWTFTAACRWNAVAGAEGRREPWKPDLRVRWRRRCNTAHP